MFTQREVVFKVKKKAGILNYFMIFVFLFFTSTLNIKTTRPPLVERNTQENLGTELPISKQHRWELLQRTFLKSPLPPHHFFPTTSGGRWAKREVKAFRNHH